MLRWVKKRESRGSLNCYASLICKGGALLTPLQIKNAPLRHLKRKKKSISSSINDGNASLIFSFLFDTIGAMRHCIRCEKSSKMVGHRIKLRGKYNPTNWTRKYPNLQWAKIDGKRARICVQCLKTLHKAPHKVVKKAAGKESKKPN